jgi:chitin synthase
MRNLLCFGEDRYLTTAEALPLWKTQFIHYAHIFTIAPDDWRVLLSQRRRWINSTIYNLEELAFLETVSAVFRRDSLS